MNKSAYIFYSLLLLIFTSCHKDKDFIQKDFYLKNYSKVILTDKLYTDVSILKTFSKQKKCEQNILYATLYVCKEIKTGNLLYVLDLCANAPSFSVDKNFTDNVCIMKDDIKDFKDNLKVRLFVPKEFSIPLKARYICATVTRLND